MTGARFDLWLSNRYRTLVQPLTSNGLPPTDNLYINVNDLLLQSLGWDECAIRRSEEFVLSTVAKHIEFLVETVKPRQYLFVAVDGSAPAAFLHAERTEKIVNKWKSQNSEILKHANDESGLEAFNPNHVTPGTEFMHRLEEHILFLIRHQMSSLPYWQTPKIIYSGSTLPGDAQTKIFEFVRFLRSVDVTKSQSMTHCIYSIKPETVLHILASKERFFCVLKERSLMNQGLETAPPSGNLQANGFLIQHMSLFWEYWALEWTALAEIVDLERTVDDFVFLCLLFGNKATPRIPTLHLMEGSLDELVECYKNFLQSSKSADVSSTATSNSSTLFLINEDKSVNSNNLEAFLQIVASDARELKRLQNRVKIKKENIGPTGQCLIDEQAADIIENSEDPYDEWKNWYYSTKWKFEQEDQLGRRVAATCYMQCLIWSFRHLTEGVCCWNFRYTHDYAPCLSELIGTCAQSSNVFDGNSKPLTQLEHMLCVLPAIDNALVPKSHQLIMTSDATPFHQYFNSTATTLPVVFDDEGAWSKREVKCLTDWISVRNIRATIGTFIKEQLFVWPELKKHLNIGYQQIFLHKSGFSENSYCKSTAKEEYDDVDFSNSAVVSSQPFTAATADLTVKKCFEIEEIPQGFPQLTRSHYCSSLLTGTGMDRYGRLTQHSSLILGVAGSSRMIAGGAKMVFEKLQGQRVVMGFPYHIAATVVGASDAWTSISLTGKPKRESLEDPKLHVSEYKRLCGEIWNTMWVEQGINIGKCGVILHLVHNEDEEELTFYPLQLVQILVHQGECIRADEFLATATPSVSSASQFEQSVAIAECSQTTVSQPVEDNNDLQETTDLNEIKQETLDFNGIKEELDHPCPTQEMEGVEMDTCEGQSSHMTQHDAELELTKEEQHEKETGEDEHAEESSTMNPSNEDQPIHETNEQDIQDQDHAPPAYVLHEAMPPIIDKQTDIMDSSMAPNDLQPIETENTSKKKTSTQHLTLDEATEAGFVSASEMVVYSEVSEESMLLMLTSCLFKTSEGEIVDIGLGLDIKGSLQSVWFSPELSAVIEDQVALGCWAYGIVSENYPSDDGTFQMESFFAEIKQQRRIIGSMRGFLDAVDSEDLVFVDILEAITDDPVQSDGHATIVVEGTSSGNKEMFENEENFLQTDHTDLRGHDPTLHQEVDTSTVSPDQLANLQVFSGEI